jgi:hypothetical protein
MNDMTSTVLGFRGITKRHPTSILSDQKAANADKAMKEDQPGVIPFRKQLRCPKTDKKENLQCKESWTESEDRDENSLSSSYRAGLVVFVVGQEATQGIHREQFRNALAWYETLWPQAETKENSLAILGPTFSGSLPSLAQVLNEQPVTAKLRLFSGKVEGNAVQSMALRIGIIDGHGFPAACHGLCGATFANC